MVVFTCNHCGDSLQKPRVDKHYQTACRRNPKSLTCVDCLKDFKFEEYVVHTKCVTEDVRYAAKGTVQTVQKGELKQTKWVETVNEIIAQQIKARPGIKNLLQMLTKYDNIPRKQNKFVNFINSSSNGRIHPGDINEVWALLEAHKNAANANANVKKDAENGKVDSTENQAKTDKKSEEKPESTPNGTAESTETKSMKKKRKMSETEAIEEPKEDENSTLNGTVESKSKKSKKKKQKTTAEEQNENEDNKTAEEIISNGAEEPANKKSKKKKNKQKAPEEPNENEETNKTGEEIISNGTEEPANKKSKKKNKQKASEEQIEDTNKTAEEIITNGTEEPANKKSKKKNKQKASEEQKENEDTNKTADEIIPNGTEEPTNKKSKKKKRKTSENQEDDDILAKKQKTETNESSEKQTNSVTENGINSAAIERKKKNRLRKKQILAERKKQKNLENPDNSNSFVWKDAIMKVLKIRPQGILKENLKKEVLAIYEKEKGKINNEEKLGLTYYKRIKKMPEIKFDGDIAKLVV